jgi:ribosomal protein L34E
MPEDKSVKHYTKKEPKFCRCRVCHEHFYAETIEEARQACQEHGDKEHPGWEITGCFCPD